MASRTHAQQPADGDRSCCLLFPFLLMSLVVDLALHIAYPKLSAHAMPPPRLLGTSLDAHSVRFALHDSGGNHGSAVLMLSIMFLPIAGPDRCGASSCVNHAVSHWLHLTITTPAHHRPQHRHERRHRLRGAGVRPVPVLAVSTPRRRRAQLLVAYARRRGRCA